MKKKISLLLAGVLVCMLAACGGSTQPAATTAAAAPATEAAKEAASEAASTEKVNIVFGIVDSEEQATYKAAVKFKEAVEAEKATVYVSYEILKAAYGDSYPIDSYELLIANPVKEFGINALKNALTVSEENYAMIEVSARFDFLHRLEAIKHFGVRSMNSKNIVYPYWENRAKGYEDISAALLALELLLMCYPVIWVLNWLRILYKNRKILKQKLLEFLNLIK